MNLFNISRAFPMLGRCASFYHSADTSKTLMRLVSTANESKSAIKYPPVVPSQFSEITKVAFPVFSGIQCNMMPFRMGDKTSLPKEYQHYWNLIASCKIPADEVGKVGYLTISESFVKKDATQRRPGIHTEKHPDGAWGGSWGNKAGLYMASNIANTCRVWDCFVESPGHMGNCEHLRDQLKEPTELKANQLVWMTDSCPHEALPQKEEGLRQFFRLVTSHIDLWYKAHSTPNPLVDLPKRVRIIAQNKFD